MRASVTGSVVPMHSYSYGVGENGDQSGGDYTEIIDVNKTQEDGTGEEGPGTTVTFGGVDTNIYSVAGSTTGGSTIGGMTEGRHGRNHVLV